MEVAPPPAPPPAEPLPCLYTVSATCDAAISLGALATVCESQLGLSVAFLDGTLAERASGEWGVGLVVSLTPSAACTLSASLSIDAAEVAASCRMHLIGEDTREAVSLLGLTSGALSLNPEANPSGYSLVVDLKPTVELPSTSWSLRLTSSAEVRRAA